MQELSGVLTPFHTLKSQMNPVVLRYFTELQKPTQMSFAGEPVPEKQDFVCCADARGSRSNPLFNRSLPYCSNHSTPCKFLLGFIRSEFDLNYIVILIFLIAFKLSSSIAWL